MKANLFFAGLCALALAATACSVDETPQTNDANAISFKATAPYASRAAAVTTNSLNSFTVWGWTESETVMDHATATRESGGSVYSTSRTYYWPGAAVDFLALTPAADADLYNEQSCTSYIGGEFNDLIDDGRGTIVTHTGHVAEAMVDHAEGFCSVHVYVPSDSKDQIDLCYASTPNKSSGTVAMNFRHALAQITFAARTTNAEQEIRIKGVKVCSVRNWGAFEFALPLASTETNLPTDDLGTDGISDSQGEWDLGPVYKGTQFSAGLDLASDGYITVPTDNTPVTLSASDGSLFLLPQEVKGWDPSADPTLESVGAYFRVECAIIDSDGSLVWPNEEERNGDESMEYAEIAVPADVVWDEGYKYTYTFVFGEGAGYYPPDDGVYPGEEIPFTPIRFDVSAGEFQPTDETDVEVEPAPVQIDYFDYIIDEHFLEHMHDFDRNGDGHLYYDELEYIKEINCAAEDFTGIEYYYNLESFTAVNAKCTSKTFEVDNDEGVLDLSNNTRLSYVYMKGAPVGTVILTGTSLTNLWDEAFRGCTNLTTVKLPDCLERVGLYAFRECSALTSIDLSKTNLVTIDELAFTDCGALSDVKLPEAIDTVNTRAFWNCKSLKSVAFPLIKNIGSNIFESCGLEAVEIPEGMETTGSGTFWSCTALTDVKLPTTLKIVADNAFYECSSLEAIEIPEGVTAIGTTLSATGSSFGQCTKLSSVTLPSTLTFIGCSAFDNCDSLESIAIPDSVTEIGDKAFENSDVLASINLPDSLTYLGEYAFDYCKKLIEMSIPAISKINEGTFRGCSGLKTVTISDKVTSIGDYAFYMCYGLSSVNLPTSLTEIGDYAFSGDYPLTSVGKVPEGVISIGKQAFYTLYLTEIDLPSTLTYIGDEAYSVCFLLTKATVRAETPPTLGGSNVFYSIGGSAVLYVPSTSVDAYSSAGWDSYFKGGIEALTD